MSMKFILVIQLLPTFALNGYDSKVEFPSEALCHAALATMKVPDGRDVIAYCMPADTEDEIR